MLKSDEALLFFVHIAAMNKNYFVYKHMQVLQKISDVIYLCSVFIERDLLYVLSSLSHPKLWREELVLLNF